ncbi:MAG: SDR family oxidoreductase [Microscillaceae bacterium]|nr:SDR family oxidoreductase [Microscillaceae bacterium]
MKIIKDKVAVITGAASGIGRSLAQQLAAQGAKVMMADWNAEGLAENQKLIESQGGQTAIFRLDVSKREEVEALFQKTLDHFGQADILINNAGVAIANQTTLRQVTWEQYEWIVGINFWGVVYGTKTFLPYFLQRPEAHIVNISSVFGLMGVATNGPYCSTKFAVRGFTETLVQELWGTQVGITCVHPGGIKTNIVKHAAGFEEDKKDQEKAIRDFEAAARTTPDQAATLIIHAIQKNKRRLLIGGDAYFIDWIVRLFPSTYHSRMMKMMKKMLER